MDNNGNQTNQLHRRPKPNLGGRPRLEEIGQLTPEMEEIAQRIRAGFATTEIADEMNITTDRVERLLCNPVLKTRIQKLFGDRLNEISLARDRLFDEGVASCIRLMRNDELPPNILDSLLRRLDPYERAMLQTEQDRKLQSTKPIAQLPTAAIVGSNPTDRTSIFKPLEVVPNLEPEGEGEGEG